MQKEDIAKGYKVSTDFEAESQKLSKTKVALFLKLIEIKQKLIYNKVKT